MTNIGYNKSVGTSACNLGGETILAWQKDFSVEPLIVSDYVCHCKVSSNETSVMYYVSCVYGPPKSSLHHLIWDWIGNTTPSINEPWILIGDFNMLLHPNDKNNSNGSTFHMNYFTDCMNRNVLHKVPGLIIEKEKNLTLEKLDMAFGNINWINQYPLTHVTNLTIAASDNSPIIMSTDIPPNKKKQVKFESYWYKFPEFNTLLQEAWHSNFRGSPSFILCCKLKSTLTSLAAWSKSRVGNFKGKIESLGKRLQTISEQIDWDTNPSIPYQEDMNQVKQELEFYYDCEMSYWSQRARTS